mmetsp:Transcript_17088/g.29981  ORF Transcript_17088/g.29981 Transcript_17088/m.29981 type:complete len:82 (+) Transcript_17088:197-442(+)
MGRQQGQPRVPQQGRLWGPRPGQLDLLVALQVPQAHELDPLQALLDLLVDLLALRALELDQRDPEARGQVPRKPQVSLARH